MSKHTPGPWEVSTNGTDWDVCAPDGGDMLVDLRGCENAEANARLIAAAPDLLAALRDLVQYADPRNDKCGSQIANARALIEELEEGSK